jgi:hypothetical protein
MRPIEKDSKRDCEAAKAAFNPLRRLAEYHAPAPVERTPGGACIHCNMAAGFDHYGWCPSAPAKESVLADRQATREAARRRRLSRYAFLLKRELDRRERSGGGLHEEERFNLTDTVVMARRLLAGKP